MCTKNKILKPHPKTTFPDSSGSVHNEVYAITKKYIRVYNIYK